MTPGCCAHPLTHPSHRYCFFLVGAALPWSTCAAALTHSLFQSTCVFGKGTPPESSAVLTYMCCCTHTSRQSLCSADNRSCVASHSCFSQSRLNPYAMRHPALGPVHSSKVCCHDPQQLLLSRTFNPALTHSHTQPIYVFVPTKHSWSLLPERPLSLPSAAAASTR
jgi:hypothetical protein